MFRIECLCSLLFYFSLKVGIYVKGNKVIVEEEPTPSSINKQKDQMRNTFS